LCKFQLRFSPALANKPKGPPPDANRKPFDPFEDPPAALKITDLSRDHYLVLNKFAIIPEHFILATSFFRAQTYVLEPVDLDATRACIEAYGSEAEKGGLFAFYNCGDHSGASQSHRHIQLLPVFRMREGLEGHDHDAWGVLAEQLAGGAVAPFKTFSERISLEMTGDELWDIYLRLYRQACQAVKPSDAEAPAHGEALISYNMAMTSTTLTICPRLSEGTEIKNSGGGVVGKLALNGTVLAGTALVKSEAEWDALREDEAQLGSLLASIGLPTGS
jgi:ATP adenylyltransferase